MRKFKIYPRNSVQGIKASALSKFDDIRKLLGEQEWYYIEDYLINGKGDHSLKDILFDEDAWDDYCDWKMSTYHKKAALSASTKIRARRLMRSIR